MTIFIIGLVILVTIKVIENVLYIIKKNRVLEMLKILDKLFIQALIRYHNGEPIRCSHVWETKLVAKKVQEFVDNHMNENDKQKYTEMIQFSISKMDDILHNRKPTL